MVWWHAGIQSNSRWKNDGFFWNEISIFELTSPTLIDNIERTKLKFIENSSFLISLHYTYNKSLSWKVLYTLECSSCRTIFIICQQIALNTSLHQFIHTLFSIYLKWFSTNIAYKIIWSNLLLSDRKLYLLPYKFLQIAWIIILECETNCRAQEY